MTFITKYLPEKPHILKVLLLRENLLCMRISQVLLVHLSIPHSWKDKSVITNSWWNFLLILTALEVHNLWEDNTQYQSVWTRNILDYSCTCPDNHQECWWTYHEQLCCSQIVHRLLPTLIVSDQNQQSLVLPQNLNMKRTRLHSNKEKTERSSTFSLW